MDCAITYQSLPIDMSGSISKNRFRNEILWGLSLIYQLYLEGKDFCVIFDNRCDIEQLDNDQLTFYQLKTSGINYKITTLTKIPKYKKNSILSTLYSLYNKDITKELFVVSNCKLSIKDCANSGAEIISFDTLKKSDQDEIKRHISRQIGVDADMTKIKFWNSEFCIQNPQTLLLGKTNEFLFKIFKELSMKPIYFYDYMASKILDLACYERKCCSLADAKKYKGLTKNDFDKILENYENNSENMWKKYEKMVDCTYNSVKEQIELRRALSNIRKPECITLLNDSILAVDNYVKTNPAVLTYSQRKFIDEVSDKAVFDGVLMETDKKSVAILFLIKKMKECNK